MIIGHGDIASVLPNKKGCVFFASGVSNSQETRESEYRREEDLLMKQNKKKHIVYFGSLCIFYSNTRYARHKKYMEELVRKNFKHYTIVRMGNITWGKNPHTIINFLRNRYRRGEPLEIRNVYRYLVDKDEFLHWIALIPEWPCEINIPGHRLKVAEIVKKYVKHDKRT
ncbi:MAG: NAD(P)-dependent oxidoreductase [Candidatus Levybacteria bacterium]|nr:NAD(P)-dependent oxidoreductase [Candidatus Levybacteria bacterium]